MSSRTPRLTPRNSPLTRTPRDRVDSKPKEKEPTTRIERGNEPAPSLHRHFRGHYGPINSVFFHPYKSTVVSGSDDGNLIVWDYKNMKSRAQRFEGHKMAVNDVAFSPEYGDLMLSGSSDQSIRVWVPMLRGEVRTIKGHSGAIRSVAFHPKIGNKFLSCSNDKTVKLWDVEHSPATARRVMIKSNRFLGAWRVNTNYVNSVRFKPDGDFAITASDDRTLTILDIRAPKETTGIRVDESFGLPTYVEFNPAHTDYIGAVTDSVVLIYDTRNPGKLVQCYQDIHTATISKFNFHPSGDYAVTVSEDCTIKILDLVEGRPSFTLYGSHTGLRAVHTSPNGNFLATAGRDKDLLVWKTSLFPYKADEEDIERHGNNNVEMSDGHRQRPGSSASQGESHQTTDREFHTDSGDEQHGGQRRYDYRQEYHHTHAHDDDGSGSPANNFSSSD